MSFHAGYVKKTPSRSSHSSTDSLKRKSGDLQDDENVSPNVKEAKTQDGSVRKARITRSASGSSGTASGIQPPKRTSKLAPPTTRSSRSGGKAVTTKSTAESKRRVAVTEKSSNERAAVKTPSKSYDRSSILSPAAATQSHSKKVLTPPSSVMKYPKQCLTERIKDFFDKAPIKSEEEINLLINPKLKPKNKWVDFREKAKRQTEVIGDLKGVLKETLNGYKHVQESCVGAEKTMEERYQSIRNSLKEQLKVNLELKTNEAQLQSEFARIYGDYTTQSLEVKELNNSNAELSLKNDEFSKMVSELADKFKTESDLRVQVETLLETTKRDLANAVEEKVSTVQSLKESNEKKMSTISSEFKEELQSLRADVERKQADLERFSAEKEQINQKATDARETILKSQSELREKEFAAQRYQQDFEKANAEVEQLKVQITQKDTDLRNTLGSMQEFQRLASEEKSTLRAEISALQPRVFQLEEQRLTNNSELAAKKEELLSVSRECSQLKESMQKLQETLAQRDKEVDEAKLAVMQLGVEKEMRMKSEMREENERAERVAASAQLVATQTECEYRVREIEANAQGQEKQLQEEINQAHAQQAVMKEENRTLQERIAGFEGELAELNRALQHAEANHEAVTELSKVKGEVEMYKRRVAELEKAKSTAGESASLRIAELEEELAKGDIQRRKLHNVVQELRGNVRVYARVRPYLPSDGDISTLESPINTRSDNSGLKITRLLKNPEDRPESHGFSFDKVFNPSTSQENVFDEVSEFVQSALDGFNVCLFSYGQTGSGKTHTMQGSGDGAMRGIIPRAIQQVGMYKTHLEEKGWEYSMEVSFIEIYNETIRDLLRQNGSTELKHEIKKDTHGKIYVSDVTMSPLDPNDKDQLNEVMELAARHRSVAHTAMNSESSRSHSIFALHLKAKHAEDNVVLRGTLSLVDLAGSERLDRSEATGSRMKETMAINKSLSSLTDVFTAIANKQAHIPFRNSKLTHLLQPALSGDGKALMMVNLSPTEESYHESLCSLRFASQVNQCELGKPRKQVKEVTSSASQSATTNSLATSKTSSVLARGNSGVSTSTRPTKVQRK